MPGTTAPPLEPVNRQKVLRPLPDFYELYDDIDELFVLSPHVALEHGAGFRRDIEEPIVDRGAQLRQPAFELGKAICDDLGLVGSHCSSNKLQFALNAWRRAPGTRVKLA